MSYSEEYMQTHFGCPDCGRMHHNADCATGDMIIGKGPLLCLECCRDRLINALAKVHQAIMKSREDS